MSEEELVGTLSEIDLETILSQMPLLVELKVHFSTMATTMGYNTVRTRYEHLAQNDRQSVQLIVEDENRLICKISLGTGSKRAVVYATEIYYLRVKAHLIKLLKTAKIHIDLVKIPKDTAL